MARDGEKVRASLFDLYATNLQLYLNDVPMETFVCPICLGSFTKKAMHRVQVHLAHVYPDSRHP